MIPAISPRCQMDPIACDRQMCDSPDLERDMACPKCGSFYSTACLPRTMVGGVCHRYAENTGIVCEVGNEVRSRFGLGPMEVNIKVDSRGRLPRNGESAKRREQRKAKAAEVRRQYHMAKLEELG